MTFTPPQTVGIQLNGELTELAPCSLLDLLASRDLAGKRVAIERNGSIVPRSRHAQTFLQSGDVLEIVVAVGGG